MTTFAPSYSQQQSNMEKKINPLSILALAKDVLNLSDEQVANELKALLIMDKNFFNFVHENAKTYLFVVEGKGNPTADELANAAGAFLYTISINLMGGALFFKKYMEEGSMAIFESIANAINDDNEKKVG